MPPAVIASDPAKAESLLREALGYDLYHGAAHNNLGVLLLNEPLTARLLVALGAVCVGIWLVNRPVQRG